MHGCIIGFILATLFNVLTMHQFWATLNDYYSTQAQSLGRVDPEGHGCWNFIKNSIWSMLWRFVEVTWCHKICRVWYESCVDTLAMTMSMMANFWPERSKRASNNRTYYTAPYQLTDKLACFTFLQTECIILGTNNRSAFTHNEKKMYISLTERHVPVNLRLFSLKSEASVMAQIMSSFFIDGNMVPKKHWFAHDDMTMQQMMHVKMTRTVPVTVYVMLLESIQ